jgi:hypothetical protein
MNIYLLEMKKVALNELQIHQCGRNDAFIGG